MVNRSHCNKPVRPLVSCRRVNHSGIFISPKYLPVPWSVALLQAVTVLAGNYLLNEKPFRVTLLVKKFSRRTRRALLMSKCDRPFAYLVTLAEWLNLDIVLNVRNEFVIVKTLH